MFTGTICSNHKLFLSFRLGMLSGKLPAYTQVLLLFVWDCEGSKAKMSQLCMHVAPNHKHNLPVPDAGWLCPLSWPFFCPGAFWGLGAGDRVAALGSFTADFSSLLLPDSF